MFGLVAMAAMAFMSSCEGPMGPAGPAGANGVDGADGVDANQNCKLCHNPALVDMISVQFEFSKHSYGEAAFEEAGNLTCSPCHTQEAFKDVVARGVLSTFTLGTPNYVNNYTCSASTAYGELGCSTCHSSIHATYDGSYLPSLTTVAPVSLTIFGAAKTIDLTQDGGISNLCVKCHQPRPITVNNGASPTGNPLDYVALAAQASWNDPLWTGTSATVGTGKYKPSYRYNTHYGVVGAVFAGVGGVEVPGSEPYANSAHTTVASCQDCHMAPMNGRAGEHTFVAKGNFNGCNATGCHTGVDASSSAFWTTPGANIKALLDQLGLLLTAVHNNGTTYPLLNINTNTSESAQVVINGVTTNIGVNLWTGATTNKYDGYLNIVSTFNPKPGQALVIPDVYFTLTNLQMAAIMNFQFGLREFSQGIHNYKYIHALLSNSIEALGQTPVN